MWCQPSQTIERAILLALGISSLGACATQQGAFVPLGADHPAHPQAEPGWFVDVGATLTLPDGAVLSPAVGAGADEPGQSGAHERIYACPMHPEVRSAAPGTCPICGMRLEEMELKDSIGEAVHVQ